MDFEIAFYVIIWLIGGIWVAFKRDWYRARNEDGSFGTVSVIFSVIAAPISILIALFTINGKMKTN